MKINTSLNKNIFYLALVQGSTYILPLLTFPYLARVLGPEVFGIFGFSQAAMQYFVMLVEYGFNWTATQTVAKLRYSKELLTKFFWTVLWSKLLLTGVAVFCLLLFCLFVPYFRNLWIIMLAFSPMLIGNCVYPIWLFQGLEEMKWITLSTIIARISIIPFVFFYVNTPSDIWLAALFQSATNVISGGISILFIFRRKWIGKPSFSIHEINQCIKNGWHVFISTSAINLYGTSTIVILGFVSGPIAVGLFNTANTIRNAAQGLLNPICQGIYPRISSLFDNDYNRALELIRKSILYLGGIALILSVLLYSFAEPLIRYGLGEEYISSVSVLRWLAPIPILVSLSNIFGVQTMLNHGYKKQFSRILLSCGIISLIIVYPLTKFYAENGAAISILITEFLVTATMYCYIKIKRINLFKSR